MSLSKHSKDAEVAKLLDEVNKMNLRGKTDRKTDRKTDKQWTELVNDYFLNFKGEDSNLSSHEISDQNEILGSDVAVPSTSTAASNRTPMLIPSGESTSLYLIQ